MIRHTFGADGQFCLLYLYLPSDFPIFSEHEGIDKGYMFHVFMSLMQSFDLHRKYFHFRFDWIPPRDRVNTSCVVAGCDVVHV